MVFPCLFLPAVPSPFALRGLIAVLKSNFRIGFRQDRLSKFTEFALSNIAAGGLRHTRAPFEMERGALARIMEKWPREVMWFFRAANGVTLMRHKCRAPFRSERDCAESQSQQR
jgi:hypothetical protein